jgi:hypothetical protein
MNEALERKLRELPDTPGVYSFLDARGRVLYVGKAKSLKKRVGSYFTARGESSERIARLVQEIRGVDWLLASSEIEALILENSLIKTSKPRYNIHHDVGSVSGRRAGAKARARRRRLLRPVRAGVRRAQDGPPARAALRHPLVSRTDRDEGSPRVPLLAHRSVPRALRWIRNA